MNTNAATDTLSTVIDNGNPVIDNNNNISYHHNAFDDEEFDDYVSAPPSYICTDNFACVNDEQTQLYFRSAYNSIMQLELWPWIQQNNGPFIMNKSPEMTMLKERMWEDDINSYHSGASYALVMREMEFIAKEGYEKFRQMHLKRG
jgi:hypothetical protein